MKENRSNIKYFVTMSNFFFIADYVSAVFIVDLAKLAFILG